MFINPRSSAWKFMTLTKTGGLKRLEGGKGVVLIVKGLRVNPKRVLLVKSSFFFLQATRIGQRNSGKIDRCRSGIHRGPKALFDQFRQHTDVIHVRVSDDHCGFTSQMPTVRALAANDRATRLLSVDGGARWLARRVANHAA